MFWLQPTKYGECKLCVLHDGFIWHFNVTLRTKDDAFIIITLRMIFQVYLDEQSKKDILLFIYYERKLINNYSLTLFTLTFITCVLVVKMSLNHLNNFVDEEDFVMSN